MNTSNHRRISRRAFLTTTAEFGLAAGLFAASGCTSGDDRRPAPPNVLLISLDTTRADHLSAYGYPRQTSPVLDRLAREGLRFANAISTSSWSLPAHASMFTGKFVSSHGARRHDSGDLTLADAFDGRVAFDESRVATVRPDETLLAEILQTAGYATGAVVGGPWLKQAFGLHRGFDHYDDDGINGFDGPEKRSAEDVTSKALAWLQGSAGKPFFLFLNYFDPHRPYALPPNFERPLDGTPNPGLHDDDPLDYDHAIRYMDSAIGDLLDGMKAAGQYDNTLIIAMGDHGELFGEHGRRGHGSTLYHGELHVPLIVRYPSGEMPPGVRDEFVQPIDLVPLILNRLGLPVPDGVQGSPIELISHPILAEVYPTEADAPAGQWQCLIEHGYKVLLNSKGNHELYNLTSDPREANNLAHVDRDRLSEMIAKLLTHMDALPRPDGAPPPLSIDAATIEELEAMGYL